MWICDMCGKPPVINPIPGKKYKYSEICIVFSKLAHEDIIGWPKKKTKKRKKRKDTICNLCARNLCVNIHNLRLINRKET